MHSMIVTETISPKKRCDVYERLTDSFYCISLRIWRLQASVRLCRYCTWWALCESQNSLKTQIFAFLQTHVFWDKLWVFFRSTSALYAIKCIFILRNANWILFKQHIKSPSPYFEFLYDDLIKRKFWVYPRLKMFHPPWLCRNLWTSLKVSLLCKSRSKAAIFFRISDCKKKFT